MLVVDDHELFRRGLTMLLGVESGIEVVGEASDGAEGTELAVSTAPAPSAREEALPPFGS